MSSTGAEVAQSMTKGMDELRRDLVTTMKSDVIILFHSCTLFPTSFLHASNVQDSSKACWQDAVMGLLDFVQSCPKEWDSGHFQAWNSNT